MSQLIFFVISILKINEYSEVMCSWRDTYTGPCEFGAYLIEPAGADTFDRAVYKKGGYRRMMRSLLSDI